MDELSSYRVDFEIKDLRIIKKLHRLQRVDGNSFQEILLRCFRERYGVQCIALSLFFLTRPPACACGFWQAS